MKSLAAEQCPPGKARLLPSAEVESLSRELNHGWEVTPGNQLEKSFRFPNFREALAFTNRAGEIAEELEHHPDLLVSWGLVRCTISTHSVHGLTRNDFILAARIEQSAQGA